MAVLDDFDSGGTGDYSRPRSAPMLQGTTYTAPTRTAAPRTTSPYSTPGLQMPSPTGRVPGGSVPPLPVPMPAPAPAPSTNQFNGTLDPNAILNFLRTGGYKPSSDGLRAAFPQLMSSGLLPSGSRIRTDRDIIDGIYVPGSGGVQDFVDMLIDVRKDSSGGDWGWNPDYPTGPSGFFDDPIGGWFMGIIEDVMGQLGQPRQLPGEVNDAYGILRGLASGAGGAGGGPNLDRLRAETTRRAGELNADPFSDTEEQAMRVKTFDNMERARRVAEQQTRERMGAQGHAMSSGTVESAVQQVLNQFSGLRAQGENDLLTSMIGERQRRRSEAMSLEQALAEAENSSAAISTQAALGNRSGSISAAQALAQMAQYMGNAQDPMQGLMALMQVAGLVPAYAQQQYDNAAGQL